MPPLLASPLWPVRWLLETLLVFGHAVLAAAGLPPSAGVTWLLAILLLLVAVRLTVLPLAVFATKNAQQIVYLAEVLSTIRRRYDGRKDRASRKSKLDEIRAAKQGTNANQIKSLIPQLIQVPLFAALYAVLRGVETAQFSAGPLSHALVQSFAQARVDGVPLSASLFSNNRDTAATLFCLLLTVVVAAAQFTNQALSLRFNVTEQATRSPFWRIRPAPLFISPLIVIATSLAVPFGLLIYLTVSSLWTLGQQGYLLRTYPLPTTRAHEARQARFDSGSSSPMSPTR